MDSRLRALERAALSGDLEAQQLLIYAQCRTFGHDWKMRDDCVKVFPRVEYKTVIESCKRCGHVENAPKPRRKKIVSPSKELVQRYAYGTVDELYREMAQRNTD